MRSKLANSNESANAPAGTRPMTIPDQIASHQVFMDVHTLSKISGIAYGTLAKWRARKVLPTFKINGSVFVDPQVVAEWLRERMR